MSEKPNIEVTLLSREEIEEKSKVLQKIGPGCKKNLLDKWYNFKRFCRSGWYFWVYTLSSNTL